MKKFFSCCLCVRKAAVVHDDSVSPPPDLVDPKSPAPLVPPAYPISPPQISAPDLKIDSSPPHPEILIHGHDTTVISAAIPPPDPEYQAADPITPPINDPITAPISLIPTPGVVYDTDVISAAIPPHLKKNSTSPPPDPETKGRGVLYFHDEYIDPTSGQTGFTPHVCQSFGIVYPPDWIPPEEEYPLEDEYVMVEKP